MNLKQVTARVISNERILGELERRDAERPQARDILGSWLMWLNCPEIAQEVKPGQFIMIRCGHGSLPRPISIHSTDGKEKLALFFGVWEDGKGTKWLSQQQNGKKLALLGPLGNGFTIVPSARRLLLVAGGIGIAPLRFLAEHTKKLGHEVTLFMGASGALKPNGSPNPTQLYPKEMLPDIVIEKISTDPHDVTKDRVIDLLNPEKIGRFDQVFACGPTPMYYEMARRQDELGLRGKPVQISLEMRMGCGRDICYACTVRTRQGLKQVCHDGPVFELGDIIWDEFALSGV